MFCSKCGAQVIPEAKFCHQCGIEIQQNSANASVNQSMTSIQKHDSKTIVIEVVGIIIGVLGMVIGFSVLL